MDDVAAGFDAGWVALANSPAFRAAARELVRPLPEWVVPFGTITGEDAYRICAVPIDDDETMVDLGCGNGSAGMWIAMLQGAFLVGIDRSPAAIATATALAASLGKSERTRFCVADAAATGLADGSVALAISFDALMYMDAAAVAKETARILRPGGFFTFTATEWTSDEPPPRPTIERAYAPILEAAGLTVLDQMTLDPDRGLPLFGGLLERESALRSEMGAAAEPLLKEAREYVERIGKRRVRDVYIMARRPKT